MLILGVFGGFRASDKCQKEKRKTINGDDLLWAMATLGFEDYIEPLRIYLARYREVITVYPFFTFGVFFQLSDSCSMFDEVVEFDSSICIVDCLE